MITTNFALTRKEAKDALARLYKLDKSAGYVGHYTLVGSAITATFKDDCLKVSSNYFLSSTIEDCIVPNYTVYIAANRYTPFYDSVKAFSHKSGLRSIKARNKRDWKDGFIWIEYKGERL